MTAYNKQYLGFLNLLVLVFVTGTGPTDRQIYRQLV